MNFKDLMQAINQLMDHMTPDRMEEFKGMSKEEKQSILDFSIWNRKNKRPKEKRKPKKSPQKEKKARCAVH